MHLNLSLFLHLLFILLHHLQSLKNILLKSKQQIKLKTLLILPSKQKMSFPLYNNQKKTHLNKWAESKLILHIITNNTMLTKLLLKIIRFIRWEQEVLIKIEEIIILQKIKSQICIPLDLLLMIMNPQLKENLKIKI